MLELAKGTVGGLHGKCQIRNEKIPGSHYIGRYLAREKHTWMGGIIMGKVIAINSNPRKNGNTAKHLQKAYAIGKKLA